MPTSEPHLALRQTFHLCLIAGNEEAVIGRCLASFAPHVESIRVVIARGNLPPDRTEEIARSFGAQILHYHNAPEHDWPHVDDFAAARNLAFAGNREPNVWLLWADCDDVLSEEGAAELDELDARGIAGCDVIWSPYVTDPAGGYERRERLIRSSVFRRWVNPVHEIMEHDEAARPAWSEKLRILHQPAVDKRGSPERNMRILQARPPELRTCREWWMLARELQVSQRFPEALQALLHATAPEVAAATGGPLHEPEQASAYLAIGQLVREVAAAEPPLLEAVRLTPDAREPFAALAQLHLRRGDPKKALSYARIMHALPEPPGPAFLRDASLYGWKADDLLCLATAAAGDSAGAAAWRERALERAHLRISVAHPTCRPEKAIEIRELWLSRAAQPARIEYIFGVNEADKECFEKLKIYPHAVSPAVPEGHSSAVANYNAAADRCRAKLIICAQDDIYPPHGWDDQIFAAMKPHLHEPKVLHVHDGFSAGQLMVIMCFTRKWLDRQGYLLCPEYDGYYSDLEFSVRAYAAGQVIPGQHIRFFHDHPIFTQAASDEAYLRQQNPEATARGRAIFERRNPEVKL